MDYKTDFPEYAPSLNILLFGIAGAGKSSFMNSILTSLLPDYCEVAAVGGNEHHVTKNIRCFPISRNVQGLGNCCINLWDTWGVDDTNYRHEFLSEILKGNVPAGFQMKESTNGRNLPAAMGSSLTRRIHAVFLFVPIGILEDNAMCQKMSSLLEEILDAEINADFIITRADTISNPHALKLQIANKFKIAENRLHLVSNYINSNQKNFLIDKVALNIFNDTVSKGENYIKSLVPEGTGPAPWPVPYPSPTPVPYPVQPPTPVPLGTVFGAYPSLIVKRNSEVLLALTNVNDQPVEQLEKFLSAQLVCSITLLKANVAINGTFYLRDIIKREGNDYVVYVSDQQFSFPTTQILFSDPQVAYSSNGQYQPQPQFHNSQEYPQIKFQSPNNSNHYNQPQQLSYSSTGQYQQPQSQLQSSNNPNHYNQPQYQFQPPYNSQDIQSPQHQSQPQQPLSSPQPIFIYENGKMIGGIRTNGNTALKVVDFRARIRSELFNNDNNIEFQFIDEYNCPVSAYQEKDYQVAQILTSGNIISIKKFDPRNN